MTVSGSGTPGGGAGGGASKAFLLAAVALGVLATVLAFVFIENSAGVDRGPKRFIVVTKRELRPNATIDPPRDLETKQVPSDFASLAALTLDSQALANYKGQRVNRRIPAGQPVFLADLSAVGELTLGAGMRALTIPAEPGVVIPGDMVKVIVSRLELAPGGTAAAAGYNAQLFGPEVGYRVLAVGGALVKTRQQVTAAEQYESGNNARTVTLEVTEAQAGEIVRAMGNNQQKATLLLCMAKEKLEAGAAPTTQP